MPGSFSSNHSNGGFTGVAALRKVTSGVGDVNQAQLGPYKDSLKATDRKKVGPLYLAARKWVKVDRNGTSSIIQAEKNELTHQLGVQLRDLRVLDPYLAASYPSAILSRDRALVVNLEHIKCIIATDHVLVTNAEDDTVLAFVEELQRRCASCIDSDGVKQNASQSSPDLVVLSDKGDMTKENMFPFLEIPFELRVLEVVLESVCYIRLLRVGRCKIHKHAGYSVTMLSGVHTSGATDVRVGGSSTSCFGCIDQQGSFLLCQVISTT